LKSLVLADVPLNEINATPEWPVWWPSLLKFRNLGVVIQADERYPELTVLEELARPQIRQRVDQLMPGVRRLPYGWSKGTERTAKRWLELLHRTTARKDIRFRQVSAADLAQIYVRTLAIYGMESKWRSSAEILQDCLPKVEVAYIEEAGHAHPWERPEDFLNHLVPFLAESDRLDPDPSRSRRQYERLPVEMAVYLRTAAGIYYPARTLNASRNGLLLDCPEALGGNGEIEIVAPIHRQDSSLVIPGRIVREVKDDAGEGFRLGLNLLWQDEPEEQHEIWEKFLARH